MLPSVLLVASLAAATTASPLYPRDPNAPIWKIPQSEWTAFNSSVAGRLRRGTPIARPCFALSGTNVAGSPDLAKCSEVQQNYAEDRECRRRAGQCHRPKLTRLSEYIADQFGGYHTANWGTCQRTGDQCQLDYNLPQNPLAFTARVCQQGSVPPYYVDVREASDVTRTIAFVKKFKIPLVVKNSGVRSSRREQSCRHSLTMTTASRSTTTRAVLLDQTR